MKAVVEILIPDGTSKYHAPHRPIDKMVVVKKKLYITMDLGDVDKRYDTVGGTTKIIGNNNEPTHPIPI